MRIIRLIAVGAWLATGGLLAACSAGGGHPHASSARTGPGASPDRQTAAIVASATGPMATRASPTRSTTPATAGGTSPSRPARPR